MTNTSRNSITKQPHNKKSNHQHHAAHASVIYLRIMSIAILTHLKIGGDDGGGNGGGGDGGGGDGGGGDGGDGGASGGGDCGCSCGGGGCVVLVLAVVAVVVVVVVVDTHNGASSLSSSSSDSTTTTSVTLSPIIIINVVLVHWQSNPNITRERNSKKTKHIIPKSSKTTYFYTLNATS
jgi:hypothetical protein